MTDVLKRNDAPRAAGVAVVMVNWNGRKWLEGSLPALKQSIRREWPVYVVDNGSTDGSPEYVRSNFPAFRLMALESNTGFARANNAALRDILAQPHIEYVCLLNSDTRPDPQWIEHLLIAAQRDGRIGIAAPKILSMDQPDRIDSTGHVFRFGRVVDRGKGCLDRGQYDRRTAVIGGCAAACLYRTEMLRQIGNFDESFGSYFEDVDLSWRAHRAGWKAAYVPAAVVHHKGGGTSLKDPTLARALRRAALKNMAVCISRNAAWDQKCIFLAVHAAAIPFHALRFLLGGPRSALGLRFLNILRVFLSLWRKAKIRPVSLQNCRPRHVCYVVSKLGVGGAEKNLLLLARNLPKNRWAPMVLSLNGEGAYAGLLREAGVPVYSLGFPHPRFIPRAFRFFSRCSFDLFHGFMFHGNLAARILAVMFDAPSISALRVAEGEKRWHLALDRRTSAWVDRYTANSEALAAFARETIGVSPDRLSVIPNALAAEDGRAAAPRDPLTARQRLKIPVDTRLVAMVGRLHIQKDPETFVRAAALIRKAEPETTFLIAGIGPLRDKLEKMIRHLGLTDCLLLPGIVDAQDVYTACDVFVLSSRWEGFPNAAIEAMAGGRAAVLSDFPGASEVVDYGVTGLIFPREDAQELARAVVGLLRDEAMRVAMGRRARETVLARYTADRMVSENLKIYEQLIPPSSGLPLQGGGRGRTKRGSGR
ncbi:glycosyltransferase [bacterium]|nr:glycosyltransferase [bacterium]